MMPDPPAPVPGPRSAIRDDGRLRVGERFRLGGEIYRVQFVNDCRAHCLPVRRERVAFADPSTGEQREFLATSRAIDISPTSLVERV